MDSENDGDLMAGKSTKAKTLGLDEQDPQDAMVRARSC